MPNSQPLRAPKALAVFGAIAAITFYKSLARGPAIALLMLENRWVILLGVMSPRPLDLTHRRRAPAGDWSVQR